jgi:hypothetical protein
MQDSNSLGYRNYIALGGGGMGYDSLICLRSAYSP